MEELKAGGAPAPRIKMAFPLIVGGVIAVLLGMALWVLFGMARTLENEHYRTRAVMCDMESRAHVQLSKECLNPDVEHYRSLGR